MDIITEANVRDSKKVETPISQQHKLSVEDGEPLANKVKHRRLIGKLFYLTLMRPNLAMWYIVKLISQKHQGIYIWTWLNM